MNSKQIVVILILCSTHLFGLYYNLGQIAYFILDGIGGTLIFFKILGQDKIIPNRFQLFRQPLIWFYVAILASSISCYINHNQNILATIIAMRYFIYLSIYFAFSKANLRKEWFEKAIIIGASIYLLIFITQVVIFPVEIVNVGRIEEADRGLLRFRIEGAGFLMLAGFLCLNRFLIQFNWRHGLFYLICLGGLFMLGFRTLLITALFTSAILMFRISNRPLLLIRNLTLLFMIIVALFSIPYVRSFTDEAVAMTMEQAEMDDDYIRFQTFDFFYNQVNKNNKTLIFGNGFPQEDSEYGQFVKDVGVNQQGFIFQDLGLIGFGIIYGATSLLALLMISFIAISTKTKKEDLYLGCYFIYLLTSSITTTEIYRIGIFGVMALALHLIDLSAMQLKLDSLYSQTLIRNNKAVNGN